MNLSIVSGTYNRLPYLKKMVGSVKRPLLNIHGFRFEIILVDGGSTDGTQEWAKKQSNIKLIEHNELRGAVKAFNDGAYTAIGSYVIMANDDIEFVGNSILVAFAYMETHPDCGGGCFYQDRNGRDWHVESMPAVTRDKQQIHVPYAQVGIFPKWLGDHVGWWCRDEDFAHYLTQRDYKQINDGLTGLHTYGGDNELSAKIIDLGYKISPIPGAKITDKEADDDLRKINNISGGHDPKSVRGHHPDSWKWGKRWFRRNERLGYRDLAGPIIKDKIMIDNPAPQSPKERVLYLPLFEQGWTVLKEQKRGLRDALARIAYVVEYDYMERLAQIGKKKVIAELQQTCSEFMPTIFLSQFHNADQIKANDIANLRGVCGNGTHFVNWNGDYWPDQQLSKGAINLAKQFDLMTTVNREVVKKYEAQGIKANYWQNGWEPEGKGYEPIAQQKHDVVFLASGYSEKRQRLGKFLTSLNSGYKVAIYGHGWPDGRAKGENLYNFREACKIYRGAKLAIGDSQWPESGFVSNRIFQILAAGNCVLCHQWFYGFEQLGLQNGHNCLIWRDIDELNKMLPYWLSGNSSHKLAEIAANGEKLALERHSFDSRVSELWEMLGIGINQDEGWRW